MAQLPLPLTDESIMPFGKHKGQRLADVPDGYLMFIYDNYQLHPNLKTYIEENIEAIKVNIKRQGAKKNERK